MRILHTYCLNYNLGDHALGYGVKKVLRKFFPVGLIGETNLQGQQFDDYFIDVLNRNYDLLVIGGGGVIHGAHWPNGWFWLIPEEKIAAIKIPIIVYAVGYNYFADEPGIPERGKSHLRETFRRAALFTVRNDGSQARLFEQTGIRAGVLGDPGFWVGLGEEFERPRGLPPSYAVVQLADDKPASRFGDERAAFVRRTRQALGRLAQETHVVLAPHVYADLALCREVQEGQSNVSTWPFAELAFDRVRDAFGYYAHAEFVIAMRGHGHIIPMGLGVPAIALENHPKHRGMMEDFGLGDFVVQVGDPELPGVVEHLVRRVRAEREEIRGRMRRRLEALWADTDAALSAVAKSLA